MSACIPYGFIQPVKANWEFILYFLSERLTGNFQAQAQSPNEFQIKTN